MSKSSKHLVMIGNSHIDPVWLWKEEEGLQEVKSTFQSALMRMEEFPEFEFTASSAAFYDWVRKHHPSLFKAIKKKVAEGRWHLVGGWWVEPDVNIASGESLVRQGLYGQRFFIKHFGKTARFAFNVDAFGHSKGLPAILNGQGISGYVFMRPQPNLWLLEQELFRWQDEGEESLIACRIPGEYCAWTKTAIVSNVNLAISAMDKQNVSCFAAYYGVGNHGGGPTIENIKAIREIASEYPDVDIVQGSLEDCLKTWEEMDLPVVSGELQGCFPGCYSADSGIKMLNRQVESDLTRAETLSSLAIPFGLKYPEKALRNAWKTLHFQQFHDTLAGTARKEARDEAVMDLHACLSVARKAMQAAVQAIASAVDTRGDGLPLLLINPNAKEYNGVLETDLYWRSKHPLRLKDAFGNEIAYDYLTRGLVSPDSRKRLAFRARIPAFGYAVYRLIPEAPAKSFVPMQGEGLSIKNELLSLSIDPFLGLTQIEDSAKNFGLLQSPLSLVSYEDKRDTWGGAGEVGPKIGEWRLEWVQKEEQGNARSAVSLRYRLGESLAYLYLTLGIDEPFFDIEGELDNREKLTMTVLRMPLAQSAVSVLAEALYARQGRPATEDLEALCQRYLQVFSHDGSFLVLNKSKYAYRFHEGALEIILTRSPVHAFSAGEKVDEGRTYAFSDQEKLPFHLRIYPDSNGMNWEDCVSAADTFHRPPLSLVADIHEGSIDARTMSLADTQGAYVHLIKKGEDGGIAARVQNLSDTHVSAKMTFHDKKADFELKPYELGTMLLPKTGKPVLANLLEFNDNCDHSKKRKNIKNNDEK